MSWLNKISFRRQTPVIESPVEKQLDFAWTPGDKYNKSLPREYYNNRWIWFGQDNLMPDRLNELYESSAIHSAIVDIKRDMVTGGGYDITLPSGSTGYDQVTMKQFEVEVEDETSLQRFIENITQDYIIHSVIYLKFTWNKDKTKLLEVKRLEPSKVRVGADLKDPEKINRYFYSFDWRDTGRFPIKEYAPYSKTSKECVEVKRIVKKSPGMKFYSYPQYAAATNWIELDAKISLFHKSNIENSTNPSKMIVFTQKPGSPEAKRDIIESFKKSYVGEETTGKSMIFFVDGQENLPQVTTMQPSSLDEQFTVTAEQALRNICHAHRINPIILGIKTSHSLGNPKELLNALSIFDKTVITPLRYDIQTIINHLFLMKGLRAEFTLRPFDLGIQSDEQNTTTQE